MTLKKRHTGFQTELEAVEIEILELNASVKKLFYQEETLAPYKHIFLNWLLLHYNAFLAFLINEKKEGFIV